MSDDASLLAAWKYGQALERVGDDEALEHLERRRSQDLQPGVRHWLGRLNKKLRARWDQVTRAWPEPWFSRPGRQERVEAHVAEDDGTMNRVACWLWYSPPTDLVDIGVWGGWSVERPLPMGMRTLRVVGRLPANILVTQAVWGAGPTYFVGNGLYPEHDPGAEKVVSADR